MISRNGICITLQSLSHFSPGRYATMHFVRKGGDQMGDNPYSEVLAEECITPIENFCAPDDAKFEITRGKGGRIVIKVFTKEMPGYPVLHWVFPNPDTEYEKIYQEFCYGLY